MRRILFALAFVLSCALSSVAQTSYTISVGSGAATTIYTSIAATNVSVKQLGTPSVSFTISDPQRSPSTYVITAGATYTFSKSAGFALGASVGTIQSSSGTITIQVTQSGTPPIPPKSCPNGQAVTAINSDGSVTCGSVGGSGVTSFATRTGAVTPQSGDYTAAQVTNAESTANKNQANGYAGLDGSSKLSAAQLPNPSASTLGGVQSYAAVSNQFVDSVSTSGVPHSRVIAAGDVPTLNQNTSGNAATASALDHNPLNCVAGNLTAGIAANGDAEGCTPIITSVGASIPGYSISSPITSGAGTLTGTRLDNVIHAEDYGVTFNTLFVTDATWSSGSGAVSCSNADCGFVNAAAPAGDVGKNCAGISSTGAQQIAASSCTITTVTDSQHVTVSVNASGNAVANGTFAWGTDTTSAAITAATAWLNSPRCGGAIIWPAGLGWVTQNPVQAGTPAKCGQLDDSFPGYLTKGWGAKTSVFFLAPSFLWDTATAGGCRFATLNAACLFGTGDTYYQDFGVTALGYKGFTLSGAANVLGLAHGGGMDRVGIYAVGQGVSQFRGIAMTGQENWLWNVFVDAAGSATAGISVSGLNSTFNNVFSNTGVVINSGGELTDYNGVLRDNTNTNAHSVTVNGRFVMKGTQVGQSANGFCGVNMASTTATLYADAGTRITNANSATNQGICSTANNTTVTLAGGVQITAGATNGSLYSVGKTGNVLNDWGGNSLTNFVSANWTGISNIYGADSSLGSQSVSGCSLTSAVGGVTKGQFASGTSGTCTVTITLPRVANGWVCDAHDITTPADVINQTAVSSTSATISGTTVSGDVIVWSCRSY